MTEIDPQVPWTHEQWAHVNQVVQEEASRTRVAASFLSLFGPLPASADFVRGEEITYQNYIEIEDIDTIRLATLQVRVRVRGAQMADPEMASVLALFRRAANLIARLEDAVVFKGQPGPNQPPAGGPAGIWEIKGGQQSQGLLAAAPHNVTTTGATLVQGVSRAIGDLEGRGHSGPFAVVLGQDLFLAAQTPTGSLVLPQDRIIPFLGGGSLLRSSMLPDDKGVVVALAGAPVELVVATDVSVGFLQVTTDPIFVFRVFEKIRLRIKERAAIVALVPPGAGAAAAGGGAGGAAGTGGDQEEEQDEAEEEATPSRQRPRRRS